MPGAALCGYATCRIGCKKRLGIGWRVDVVAAKEIFSVYTVIDLTLLLPEMF